MVRVSVGILYFPFFLPADFFAADFFAVFALGLADLASALGAVFLAADFFVAAFALLLDGLQRITKRVGLNEHDIRPQDVIRRDIGVRHHMRPLQVSPAEEDVLLHAVGEDEHFLVRCAESIDERNHLLRAGPVVIEVVDHDQRVLAGPRIERALASERADLSRNGLHVLATSRTENSTAADEVGSATRTLTGSDRKST